MIIKKFIAIVMIGLGLYQCKHDPFINAGNPGGGVENPGGSTFPIFPTDNCDGNTVYFEPTILELMNGNCAMSGCHDAASHEDGVILNNYQNIMQTGDIEPGNPNKSDLFEALLETDPDKHMPRPPAPFDNYQIELVRKWIEQGAQNNKCLDCDTTNVTYQNIQLLVNNACRGCHNGTNSSLSATNFTDVNVVKSKAPLMLQRMLLDQKHILFMPQGGKQNACNVHLMDRWIKNGKPE